MMEGLLLEYVVYHLHGIGPTHLYGCLYMSTLVETFSSNQIQKRLFYVVADWMCMAVTIKKKNHHILPAVFMD